MPSGTITFLFTDIQGSTKLWQGHPREMQAALARHDTVMRAAIERHGGHVFKTVGDAFCAAFPTALEGLEGAIDGQISLAAEPWETPTPILVRAALHTGQAEERDNDYFGQTLNRVARVQSIGHGGQLLLSLVTTEGCVRDILPPGVTLREMGDQRLKDLTRPESVFQVMHPSLPADFPPLNSLDAHPNNLPAQITPLVGREKELLEVVTLLKEPGTRLVTLTGPGGMGKTRLGLQSGAELIDDFKHGVYFVDLTAATTPDMAMQSVARTLRVQETGTRSLLEDISEALREKRMLLLLDNFEQVMEAAVPVASLMSACPGLKFIVTSRESLTVRGEKVYAVPPLGLPARMQRRETARSLSQYEAVRLFIERASSLDQAFHITDDNAPAVAEICARLDGIPLAIELAAARARTLAPEDILHRLDNRLRLLSAGARDLPERQRTLRATIDWSYDLLDDPLRALLRALAVFPGSFVVDVAEVLCAGAGGLCFDALDGIDALVNRSLLVRDATEGKRPRVRMLETIREYGREKLGQDPAAPALRAAHAALYAADFGDGPQSGEDQSGWLARVDEEWENLSVALGWFRDNKDPEGFAHLAVGLLPFWEIRCRLREGSTWLAEAVARTASAPVPLRARVLRASGVMARQRGDYEGAARQLSESLTLAEGAVDDAACAAALHELAKTRYRMDMLDDARSLYSHAQARARESGDEVVDADCAMGLGLIAWREGRGEEARVLFQESRAVFSRRGCVWQEVKVINNLGLICHQAGDYTGALEAFTEAMKIQERIGDWDDLRRVYNNVADTQVRLGNLEEAAAAYETLLDYANTNGDVRWQSSAHAGLAEIGLRRGRLEEAARHARAALESLAGMEPGIETGISFRLLGDVDLAMNAPAGAERNYLLALPIIEKVAEPEELANVNRGLEQARRAVKMARESAR